MTEMPQSLRFCCSTHQGEMVDFIDGKGPSSFGGARRENGDFPSSLAYLHKDVIRLPLESSAYESKVTLFS